MNAQARHIMNGVHSATRRYYGSKRKGQDRRVRHNSAVRIRALSMSSHGVIGQVRKATTALADMFKEFAESETGKRLVSLAGEPDPLTKELAGRFLLAEAVKPRLQPALGEYVDGLRREGYVELPATDSIKSKLSETRVYFRPITR